MVDNFDPEICFGIRNVMVAYKYALPLVPASRTRPMTFKREPDRMRSGAVLRASVSIHAAPSR